MMNLLNSERKLVIGIDFNNILFTSYYGSPIINSKGENVNAIRGFFFKIKSLIDIFNPDYIVCANDLSRERTFRRKLYKPYKAQRKPVNPDVIKQMEYTSRISSLLGYPFINDETYEADDILGMISRLANDNNMDMIIVSSDRDMYQLISDHTFIFSPRGNDLMDREWLYDKYHLTPEQWIELKILQGDRSDNIPGIPGIGEVTALQLMQQYGSIEEIYNHLSLLRINSKMLLERGKDCIPLTRELVTIITDYSKLGLTLDSLERQEIFENEVMELIQDLEIYSLFNIMQYQLFKRKEISNDTNKIVSV